MRCDGRGYRVGMTAYGGGRPGMRGRIGVLPPDIGRPRLMVTFPAPVGRYLHYLTSKGPRESRPSAPNAATPEGWPRHATPRALAIRAPGGSLPSPDPAAAKRSARPARHSRNLADVRRTAVRTGTRFGVG